MLPSRYTSRRNIVLSNGTNAPRTSACRASTSTIRQEAPDKEPIEVNFHLKDNRVNHRTDEFEKYELYVRRGQEFLISLSLNYKFNPEKDYLTFIFSVGSKPHESKGTRIHVGLKTSNIDSSPNHLYNWQAEVKSANYFQDKSNIDILITPNPDAVVGKYQIAIKTVTGPEKKFHSYTLKHNLYVLFNAWCKDDQVYMENEEERQEYVLNETGRVYQSSGKGIHGKPWNFGQFDRSCLDAALHMLEISYLQTPGHGNTTKVVRALSALVNCCDEDGGVLTGNWSGNYRGGTPPYAWSGSVAILDEYMRTKSSVKFGQCWVFSAVLVTLCRALGIPTRSVTNFSSAHDHDFSFTIDFHLDCNGRPLTEYDDSVWNFHVWNESWFKRPDLPQGYDGWQAFDGTPQEASEDIMRCGPAPLKAIKNGELYFGYDTGFIFAEVNGDQMDWTRDKKGNFLLCEVNSSSVGKDISTKSVGSNERMDVTNLYKFPEGSKEERDAVSRASHYSTRSSGISQAYQHCQGDVDFHYSAGPKSNADVAIKFKMTNRSSETRKIDVKFTATAAYYTGIPGEELDHYSMTAALSPKEEKTVYWEMKGMDYLNEIDEDALLRVYLLADVKDTKQIYTRTETFFVDKPELEIKVSNRYPKVGDKVRVDVKVKNPLDIPLTDGVLRIESPGIQKLMVIQLYGDIEPESHWVESINISPRYPGDRELIATFNSRQLTNMTGTADVKVSPKQIQQA